MKGPPHSSALDLNAVVIRAHRRQPPPVRFRAVDALLPRAAHEWQRHPFAIGPPTPTPDTGVIPAVPWREEPDEPGALLAIRAIPGLARFARRLRCVDMDIHGISS